MLKNDSSKAFGFLYMYGKTGSEGGLLDFSREKDNTYMPGNPYLPQTFLQADILSVTTPFINENFRPYMNNMPVVSSPTIFNNSEQVNVDFGIEFGGGSATDFGGNLSLNGTTNQSNIWTVNNSAYGSAMASANNNQFASSTPFRNIYFRSMSSSSRSPVTAFNPQAQPFDIIGSDFSYILALNSNVFTGKYNNITTVREAIVFQPVTKEIFTHHTLYNNLYRKYESSAQKPYHISAYKLKDNGGNVFIFGCPAMNYLQKDVAFNVEGPNNNNSLLIEYTPADASLNNPNGLTNFYSSKTIPAYAYAYMLTDMYTAEYSDLTGDGPTPDDPGDYVLFSYSKKIERYKWRTPYTKSEFFASYNPNIHSLYHETSDDIASYSYGEKDVWYIDTVRSKYEMAVFYTSNRRDSKEAKSEHGGIGPRSMYKLDCIKVYNIHNYYQALEQGLAPIPDKIINFRYQYKLCVGVYNQENPDEGKLTLTDVIITDYNSAMGFRHSYKFDYSSVNPDYDPMSVDRWGNYDNTSPNGTNKIEFPYTTISDTAYAGAWRLNRIYLPSGGRISVEYETNSYCYVQNKPAMQMFQIAGVSNDTGVCSFNLHNDSLDLDNYLFFETDIPANLPWNIAQQEFKKYFSVDLNQNLYFKVYTNISPNEQQKEAIFGFAEIENYELLQMNNKYYGRIKIKGVPIGKNSSSKKVNPITKAAIHFGMINTPRLTNGHPDMNSTLDSPLQFAEMFIQEVFINNSILNNIITTLKGPQKALFDKGIGKNIDPEKSFIRLISRSPKNGGGSRVKRVIYDNSWNAMSPGEAGSSIIKEYIYQNGNGSCSGVASYEPQIGADEIPLHIPYTYNYQTQSHSLSNWARNLVPHIDYMGLYPLCESAFPSPSVGYSRVIEITKGQNNITNGYIINNFYTTKDHPTIVTPSSLIEKTPTLELNVIFVNIEKKHTVVSQGFNVVTNDMNGREKIVEYYDGYNRLLKRIKNYYSKNGKAKFYNSSNTVSGGYKGLENDIVADFREESSITNGKELMLNSNTAITPVPLFMLSALGSYNYSEVIFRSSTVTSVWYQQANLVRQEVEDRGANLNACNIYFDPVTGKPLVTSVVNSWDKKSYRYDLPAYYTYPQMGSASGYTGHIFVLSTNQQGRVTSGTPVTLYDGDKLLILLPVPIFAWIMKLNGSKYLIDQSGQVIPLLSKVRVYLWESGKKNYLDPVTHSISSKKLPDLSNNSLSPFSAANDILAAEATIYNDYYSYRCAECGCASEIISDSIVFYSLSKSTEPVYIPYTIKRSCTCNGIITLFPPDSPQLFFYWPLQDRWGVYVQNLCENQEVQLEVYTDTASSPVGTFNFTVPGSSALSFTFQQSLNPFVYKLRNAWFANEKYVYPASRNPVNTSDPVQLSVQGQYKTYTPFWEYGIGWNNNKALWMLTEKTTYSDMNGNPVENRNIINLFNTATYSHKGYLQESVTVNARSNEAGCDGLEDYFPFYSINTSQPWQHSVLPQYTEHFRLVQDRPYLITLEKAHTGLYSLKIPRDTIVIKRSVVKLPVSDTITIVSSPPPFNVQPVHCSDVFAPTPEKKYLISFWYLKEDTALSGLSFGILFDNSPLIYNIEYISPIIEGWRQFTCSFYLSGRQCANLDFVFQNTSQDAVYLDDFRVHPYNANMKTFVYNPFTFQLMAVLDENNFAGIYQYDAQQQVQNTIKETEKGRIFLDYRIKHLFRK